MAVGKIAKKMLGFADEFMEGAAKGIGDAGTIKQVNKIVSNMTPGQQKFVMQTGTRRAAGIMNPTVANRVGDAVVGGFKDTYTSLKSGETVSKALTDAFVDPMTGKTRMDRVAGAFFGTTAAARIGTGGGLYKDRNGGTNIIGLPFL